MDSINFLLLCLLSFVWLLFSVSSSGSYSSCSLNISIHWICGGQRVLGESLCLLLKFQFSHLDILNSIPWPSFRYCLYAHIFQISLPGHVSLQSSHNSWLAVKHLYLHILLAVHIQGVLQRIYQMFFFCSYVFHIS